MPKNEIAHAEFIDALKPLLDLIGVEAVDLYADSFCVESDAISGYLVEPRDDLTEKDAVEIGEPGQAAVLAWPFRVAVNLG